MNVFKELYQYREMIFSLIRKDLRGKYKGSFLGFLWTFVNPLLQLVVYTVVFSVFFKTNIDKFYIFLFVGLVPWLFFNTSLVGGSTSIVSQENLIKKIYFPRQVLPISFVTSGFVNMLLTFIVIFAVLIFSRFGINLKVLWVLPFVMIVEYLFALGISMITSALTVYFRDLEYILGIVAMCWMYMTPILYDIETIPEKFRPLIYLNPMTGVIQCYREILYYKRMPELSLLGSAFIIGIVFLVLGFFIFGKLQKRFVEEL
ncbi:MAG: ABC transporter permease [Lachnospiraceae bacterium]|jgi:ABC-type polysaccharide/polyol phosphate export systems, permease component|nr:ABC transporter permease [Lachnospiraceae bacterium]MBQ6637650.1 ABC transporter permease [Lachnospiraceae bacterium]MBR3637515.1 ABC transporter permease [Lachnospiraceae bacterium]